MNKKLLLIVFSLVLVLVLGCKKGDTGSQGPARPQGIQGVKGDNGSMIFSGNDVPAASLGTVGDFYFRMSNTTMYGPKTAAGLGTGVSLRGAPGTANVIYSGWLSFTQASRDSLLDGSIIEVNHLLVPMLTQNFIDGGVILV